MSSAFNKRVRIYLGVNISDGPRGAMTLDLKALALVNNISGSRGVGWRYFGWPRRMLEKSWGDLTSGGKGA